MTQRANNFGTARNFGRRVIFPCGVCLRMTRDTGQGVDHLCEDCYEIAGIDNSINDNHFKVGSPEYEVYRSVVQQRLNHIAKLGGKVEQVIRQNDFLFADGHGFTIPNR